MQKTQRVNFSCLISRSPPKRRGGEGHKNLFTTRKMCKGRVPFFPAPVTPAPGTVGTGEDSVNSTPINSTLWASEDSVIITSRTLGTNKDTVTSAPGTLGIGSSKMTATGGSPTGTLTTFENMRYY